MNFKCNAWTVLGAALMLLTGCNTTDIRQEQASQREDLRQLQEKLDRLSSDIVSVQSENEDLRHQVSNLKEDLAASHASNDQYQKDISRLDDLIKKLDTARDQDRKVIVDEVSQEISRLSKKIQSTNQPAPPQVVKPAPTVVEEGLEHVVAKGETLSAIAKAYGVSVKQIQEANKLSSGLLKTGQKLFIPSTSKPKPKK